VVDATEQQPRADELPRGDIISVLLEQHEQIRSLFAAVNAATGKAKQQSFDDLRLLLARHETAEEMILRPVTRLAGAETVAQARNDEEDAATRVLAELEKLDVSSADFERLFASFEESVTAHAEREELEEFPHIRAARTDAERVAMGHLLLLAEKAGPTHPHPSSAGSTVAQYALGPFASLLDHARDAVKKATN
jgi:hemerythrin superfamily protein